MSEQLRFELTVVAAGAAVGLFLWSEYWPSAGAWMRDRADANIGQRAYVSCEPPAEFEQLHIVVTKNEGRIAASCMYIGSRGTYTRRSVRQAAAQ